MYYTFVEYKFFGLFRKGNKVKIKTILFYAIPIILGGCIPIMSINPFYKESDVMFEQKLVGTWVDDINEPQTTWQFTGPNDPNEKVYKLIFTDKQGEKGLFLARLMKLQDKLFLDLYPAEILSDNESDEFKYPNTYSLVFMIPVHTILKVESIEPQLLLVMTEVEEIKKLLKEHPDSIEYSEVEGRIILTSQTKELRDFILKYADDEKLFPGKITLNRKE